MNPNRYIYVSKYYICTYALLSAIYIGYLIYLIYIYSNIPRSLLSNYNSIIVMLYMLCIFLNSCITTSELLIKYTYIDQQIRIELWKLAIYTERYPYRLLKIVNIFDIAMGLYFLVSVERSGCMIYNNIVCDGLHIIAYISLIKAIIYAICIFIFLLCSAMIYCVDSYDNCISSCTKGLQSLLKNYVINNIKIIEINSSELNENECIICTNEPINKEEWKILNCNHKYHSMCISSWMLKSNTCPICRQVIKKSLPCKILIKDVPLEISVS